ncbi:MAG: glycosyltransferase [archaeon]
MKKIAIIIPTLNEEENIGRLIDSIKNASYKNKEIIVVDDGSKDRTVETAKKKGASVILNRPKKGGPAFCRNKGARYSDAEIICFLDADSLIEDKQFFARCLKEFEDKTVVAVYTSYKTIQCTLLEKIVTLPKGISMEPKFIIASVFLKVGGFPEIGFGEDQVLVERLREYEQEKGLREKVVSDAYFSGHGVHSLSEMYKQAKWYGKTSVMFLSKIRKSLLKQFFRVYLRPIYFLSFVGTLLSLINSLFLVFLIPFILIFLSIILDSIKKRNPYSFGRTLTFLLFGLGMIHGLIISLFAVQKGKGY